MIDRRLVRQVGGGGRAGFGGTTSQGGLVGRGRAPLQRRFAHRRDEQAERSQVLGGAACGDVVSITEDMDRRLYTRLRVKRLCVDCGRPAQGACRCETCAKRSYELSDHFRGIPVWEPSYIVVETATGREHGPFDDPADVALCLAFAKLRRDEVAVISDASPMTGLTSWL